MTGVTSGMNVTPSGDDPGVTTQLRLVDPPPASRAPRKGAKRPASRRRASVVPAARGRAVHWDVDWRLDARTRKVGRQGVAAAKAALERAPRPDAPLSQAS